jgi:hypothetical protein
MVEISQRIKIMKLHNLLLGTALAGLISCGDAPDESAPILKSDSDILVSPFDSVVVEFDEDLVSFAESNYEATPDLDYVALSDKKIALYGTETYWGGFSKMAPGQEYEVRLLEISDDSGNEMDEEVYSFRTMPVIDHDYEEDEDGGLIDNGSVSSAEILGDSTHFFNDALMSQTLKVAGVLSDKAKTAFEDHEDVYRILVRTGDSLIITLSGLQQDLDLEFKGPRNKDVSSGVELDMSNVRLSENDDTEEERLEFTVDANQHTFGTDMTTEYLEYWITVYYKETPGRNEEMQTPYVLSLKKVD